MRDCELLNRFVDEGSRADFDQLVRRHIDLVYATALRDVRDRHLAEDVTQAVFILLLRKARRLSGREALGGWLFRAARFCARDALRRQRRRALHERRAAIMRSETAGSSSAELWWEIAPMLNEAIASLGTRDRNAIIARFLQGGSMAQVALQLGSSEEAAKQRVFRAVGKLRQFLQKRAGVTATSAALATALETEAWEAAPAALAAATPITAIAAAQGVLPAGNVVAAIAKGASNMMTWIKVKLVATAATGTALVVGGMGVMMARAGDGSAAAGPAVVAAAEQAGPPAPQTRPTSRPADAATAVQIDLRSPMATLRTNKRAMAAGDAAVMKRLYYTTDPAERKAIDAIMDYFAAMVQLQRAAGSRWGEEAGGRLAPGFNLYIPPEAREEIEGERGTLYNVGGPQPTRLVKVEGEWRFTYGSLVDNNFRDLPSLRPEQYAQVFETGERMYAGLTAELAAGKFERVEDAMRALRDRRQEWTREMRQITAEAAHGR